MRFRRTDPRRNGAVMDLTGSVARLLLVALGASALAGCNQRVADRPVADARTVGLIRQALSQRGGEEPEESSNGTAAQPTGWATLSGRFQLVGTPPTNPPLDVSGSDVEICAPGGHKVFAQDVVVGPDGGLKNVVIFLATEIPAEEPWTHPDLKAAKEKEVQFDQKECVFLSHVAAVQVGQKFEVLNSDPIGHNTKIQSNPAFNQIIPAHSKVDVTFSREEKGPIPVSCSIHPWMRAHLLIRNNGYFAVTKEDGSFEIPNLPAGVELEFRVWQERLSFLTGVEIAGTTVNKGRFVTTLDSADPAANHFDVKLDATLFQ